MGLVWTTWTTAAIKLVTIEHLDRTTAATRPFFDLVQLVLINGSLLYNWEAAVLHSGNCKNWVALSLLFD
jgi:hypothetical protein